MESLLDVLDRPTYPPSFAGILAGLSPGRVRRWLRGYEYMLEGRNGASRRIRKRPVVVRAGAESSSYASFLDLVDLLFVKGFLDRGFSLQKVRKALEEAQEILGGHHFAQREFFTDGKGIYLQVSETANALLQLLSGGQWVIAPIIKHTAKQIDFDIKTGFAERWYPLGKSGGVIIDPRIAFGAPAIPRRAIKTSVIYDLYKAENDNVRRVSEWMHLREREVQRAIAFEERLRTAA